LTLLICALSYTGHQSQFFVRTNKWFETVFAFLWAVWLQARMWQVIVMFGHIRESSGVVIVLTATLCSEFRVL